jgi:hypothetical protein
MEGIKHGLFWTVIVCVIAFFITTLNPINSKEATKVSEINLVGLGKAFTEDMKSETDTIRDFAKTINKELSKKSPDWELIDEYLLYISATADFIDEEMLSYEENLESIQAIIDDYKEKFYNEE